MNLKFEVSGRINRPVEDVFEAVADPAKLSSYFTTGGAKGRLETGATVTWDFHDFPGAFPVHVVEVEPNKRIVLKWGGEDGSSATLVTMRFEPTDDGRTIVSIAEEGWPSTEDGLKNSYGNCMGWSQMICAMKAWVEHGINLRDGMYA
ncbi:MAG: ATPase [Hyphomonas sp.]|uniref:SRPBCC family protein n=1 Tax=unclassified Hyphomonas TaxID=2630699 RepID=UPI000B6ADEC4|nr:SRPBCC family protein [Hyphomonas sp.]MAH93608.1 ATPase [Hyphomonas sp.]OUX84661.1 MAG: ATPase [Hyphomonas sp. TMED31]|tara:strand:+ start:472 stop:915 length:444 start_codon:yes stop_codon:yes gene_type:complete